MSVTYATTILPSCGSVGRCVSTAARRSFVSGAAFSRGSGHLFAAAASPKASSDDRSVERRLATALLPAGHVRRRLLPARVGAGSAGTARPADPIALRVAS